MALMYSLGLPPQGIIAVRRAASAVDDEDLREHGLDCRTYFPGSSFVMRLEGEGDLLDKMRKTKSGGALLASLKEHAWFDDLRQPLDLMLTAGTERDMRAPPAFTGIASFSILHPLDEHVPRLLSELREVAPTLERACPLEFWHAGDALVMWCELQELAQVDQILHEDLGGAIQRVLHEHTGYTPVAWRQQFSVDQAGLRLGVKSRSNFAPDVGERDPKGTLGPMPRFRTPPNP